jgi:hypothetical protein
MTVAHFNNCNICEIVPAVQVWGRACIDVLECAGILSLSQTVTQQLLLLRL